MTQSNNPPDTRLQSKTHMAKGSILIVDDEVRQREIYRDILQDEGYDTETAPSGESALKLLGHFVVNDQDGPLRHVRFAL